jgi:hypothetical protein
MKSGWQKYLLYASIVIVGGFILFETARLKNTGFEGKSLWDWMELLIIPTVLAGGAFFLNRSERNTEREIATDRQQEAALQSYLGRMAELLLKEKLRTTKKAEVRDVARTLTLTLLRGLDPTRKVIVLRFLIESGLIYRRKPIVSLWESDFNDIYLRGALFPQALFLSGAKFHTADLSYADLRGSNLGYAELIDTNLFSTFLSDANLFHANLRGANLALTHLDGADLRDADLRGATLKFTHLKNAKLRDADLRGAEFLGVGLQDADLTDANLEGSKVTNEELALAKSLKGATMPDGTKHK